MRTLSQFRVDANGSFDHEVALGTLAAHAVEGLIHLNSDAGELTRWINVNGEPQLITVHLDSGGATISTTTRDEGINREICARVRHWFDLDADLSPINTRLGADPVFADQVRLRPGIRITRFHAPFEGVIRTVLGQQVSLAAGRLFAARLVAAYGADHTSGTTGIRGFPSPSALARAPTEELRAAVGLTGARARTVHEAAVFFTEGADTEHMPARADLHAVYGIGPWTLDYLAIRAGTDTDAFPATDAVLRRVLAAFSPKFDAARIASWSPYRSYAASRLWAGAL